MNSLNDIKLLLGITDTSKDSLLSLLVNQCLQEVKDYTHNPNFDDEYIVDKMVVYRFNQLGSEGLNSEGYSGVSFTYATDYPKNILNSLNHYRKVRVISND